MFISHPPNRVLSFLPLNILLYTFSLFPLQQLYFFLLTFLKLFSSTICRFILAVLAPMCWGSGEMGNRQVKTCQRSIFAAALLRREPPASTPLSRLKSHFTLLRSPLSASHTSVVCFVLASYHTGQHQRHIKPERLTFVSALSLFFLLFLKRPS